MPHSTDCPWCNVRIGDWFIEWYLQPQYDEIKNGQLPMDCPNHDCRKPVLVIKGKLIKASVDMKPAPRPIEGAERWVALSRGLYPNLVSFLTAPVEQNRAKYFRSGYWPQINV